MPAECHAGQAGRRFAAQHAFYQAARLPSPQRWSQQTRDWASVATMAFNPERDTVVRAAQSEVQLSGSIGKPAFPSRSS